MIENDWNKATGKNINQWLKYNYVLKYAAGMQQCKTSNIINNLKWILLILLNAQSW